MSESTYSSSNIRASVVSFAIGKAFTAPATFILIFLFATFMARHEYAANVAATAMMEIAIAISTCGLDWLAQKVVPAIRVNGNRDQLRRVIRLLMTLQAVPYCIVGLLLFVLAPRVSTLFSGVVPPELVRIYALIVPIEGVFRFLRDQAMSALLLQRVVQMLHALRQLTMIVVLLTMHYHLQVEIRARDIAIVEIACSFAGLLIAAVAVLRYLRSLPAGADGDRTLHRWINRDAVRFAANAYFSFMLTICLGQEVVTSLVARYLGAEATAQFGFSIRLIEQIRRFLPMDLLWMMIRPALVGRFEREGHSFSRLAGDVGIILRANLLLLGAAAAILLGAGDEIVRTLTKGNIHLPPFLLAAMLVQVLGHSVRRSLELITFLTGQGHLFLIGSFASLAVPAILLLGLESTQSLYMVVAAMGLAETLFCSIVYRGLIQSGRRTDIEGAVWLRLAVAVVVAGLCVMAAAHQFAAGLPGLIAATAIGVASYLLMIVLLRVVSRADATRLRSMLRPRASAAPS